MDTVTRFPTIDLAVLDVVEALQRHAYDLLADLAQQQTAASALWTVVDALGALSGSLLAHLDGSPSHEDGLAAQCADLARAAGDLVVACAAEGLPLDGPVAVFDDVLVLLDLSAAEAHAA